MVERGSFDSLSGLAPLLRVRPELQHLCRFGAQWATDHSAERGNWAPFHIVTNGACVIDLTGLGRSIRLDAGDVALLPHGSRHVVRGPTTPPGAAGPFGIEARPGEAILVKSNTGGEPDTQLVCGRLRFDEVARNLVLGALPEAIVVAAAEGPDAGRMRQLATVMKDELDSGRPGAAAVAVDLASALLVMVVRAHLERECASDGLLGLLGHPQAGPAVAAMLAEPGRAWSLDELAARANASRASLVRMFQRRGRVAPLALLAELRLELARRKLRATSLPLDEIAAEVGYRSASAFSRAFVRRFGMRPGEVRAGGG
jgi:AraC family transcriptional activator of mtrCDE